MIEPSEGPNEDRTNWKLVYTLVLINTCVVYLLLWWFSEAFK